MRWDVIALTAAAVLCLGWQYRADRRRRQQGRNDFFADCRGLLERARLLRGGQPYPVLAGRYKGLDVRLEPFLDDMALRKLPSLWLTVSLLAPVRYAGALDLLVRPRGNEYFSPAAELAAEIKAPPGWPADATLRSDDPDNMPPAEALAPHLPLFEDAKVKELLIAPGGVRLVYQVEQAERSHYVVLRQCEIGAPRLAPDLARRLLEAARSVYESVAAGAAQPGEASS